MNYKHYLFLICGLLLVAGLEAHVGPKRGEGRTTTTTTTTASGGKKNTVANYREDCVQAEAQIDMAINNVRARLLTGGDVWWDGSTNGRYIIPKVEPGTGVPERSSIFAGAVWIGGFDPGGNLKLAAQTYSTNGEDFWPGPLDPDEGSTDRDVCDNWDRFFTVKGENIDIHLRNFEQAREAGTAYDPSLIPEDVKAWPARGNQFFFELRGFELPNTTQGLAAFFDQNGDGFYDPEKGDYPRIEIRGCDAPQYPDEMTFWIYNDAGAPHTQSNGDAIQMEIQVQAFAYATNDQINDMTFQRYKLINRAIESIDSTYFAVWVDADLGCPEDDYVGCDVDRSLAYVYNRDGVDGITGCECNVGGQINTYCDEVPILGVDYFRGPLGPKVFSGDGTLRNPILGETPDTIVELPMSSFTYHLRQGPSEGMNDPTSGNQYYNLLSGRWIDGKPYTFGGNGYRTSEVPEDDPDIVSYAFPNRPDDPNGWSMASQGLENFDTRTIQASGPFRLDPGAVNELIVGVVWVPDVQHPSPDIDPLLLADDIAQSLFDNCFDITDGPDAPDVDWIELDQELVAIFTNDELLSNNAGEAYAEVDLQAPNTLPEEDRLYEFEGYKLFQLAGPNVSIAELDDPDKARVVYQVDIRNGVNEIFNWTPVQNPNPDPTAPPQIWVPQSEVEGQDAGIRHTFRITEDQFADGDRTLINHKKYYFTAIAYAHNNYQQFVQFPNLEGQRRAYLEGRGNIGDGTNIYYTAIPRPIVDKNLNASYGDGAKIIRLDGVGAGGQFLDLEEGVRESILDGSFNGEIEYKQGRGPIDIKIFNPIDVQNGEFELTLVDENMSNDRLDDEVRWVLTNLADGTVVASETTIEKLNEQIVGQYGFTIAMEIGLEAGAIGSGQNGAIGSSIDYADLNGVDWLMGVQDQSIPPLDYLKTGRGEAYEFYSGDIEDARPVDQDGALVNISGGLFVPFVLTDYENRINEARSVAALTPNNSYISPAWMNEARQFNSVRSRVNGVDNLNNVDIIFTADKSKWSRCLVVETASAFYYGEDGLLITTEGDARSFDVRQSPSVSKDADANGMPIPDGETYADGDPQMGMGWFPGYAIDVESGKRLNILFGENSVYRENNSSVRGFNPNYLGETPRGADMMFNPSSIQTIEVDIFSLFNYYLGGQHMVYVTDEEYDEGAAMQRLLDPNFSRIEVRKVRALDNITWAGILMVPEGVEMLSYSDGLIPNDAIVKLRVDNPYQVEEGTGEFNGYPTYRITIGDAAAGEVAGGPDMHESLRAINAVPNPYYGYSAYETSQFTNTIKITNLPANCTLTIYSMDGRFIRQYVRNESGDPVLGNNRAIQQKQISPALEWDLKNNKGIPVASGVYIMHIDAPGLGERVLKWFGVQRQFDPSGL